MNVFKDAPDWAQWSAMDESGKWYYYDTEPGIANCWDKVWTNVSYESD